MVTVMIVDAVFIKNGTSAQYAGVETYLRDGIKMDRAEILAMKPGRKLDELVAVKVVGWKKYNLGCGDFYAPYSENPMFNILGHVVPEYSTDIAAAFEVVEKFDYLYLFRCTDIPDVIPSDQWECKLNFNSTEYARGKTAAEAFCKAALLAVEVEYEQG